MKQPASVVKTACCEKWTIFFILSLVMYKFATVCNKVPKPVDHGHYMFSLTNDKLCRPWSW